MTSSKDWELKSQQKHEKEDLNEVKTFPHKLTKKKCKVQKVTLQAEVTAQATGELCKRKERRKEGQ